MLRTVATILLAMSVAHALAGDGRDATGSQVNGSAGMALPNPSASEVLEDVKPTPDSSGKPAATTAEEIQAVQVARQKLAGKLQIAPEEIVLERIVARTWNDSSMGCGKPGAMALQVITEGYAVLLRAGTGRTRYRVHVSGNNAVICTQPLLERNESRRTTHARGLDLMIERARQDLAGKLGAAPADVHLFSTQPRRWADTGLDCPGSGEQVVTRQVDGYRIAFKYRGRIYTYHSDLTDVRACPPIERE